MNKLHRYSMFALLYFAQGAILSYFTAFNAIYLQSYQLTMSQIGLIGVIAMIPMVLKIFLGMLSDRVNLLGFGNRRPYIFIGLLIQATCLVLVPGINPHDQYSSFMLTAFLLMTGMALYDTCTDGLALDTTPQNEQGTIQGFMVGGRAIGVVVISSLIGLIQNTTSWTITFWSLAGLSLVPLPLVIFAQERPRPSEKRFDWKAFGAFKARPIIALGLLGALYSLVSNGINQIVNPFLKSEFQIPIIIAGFLSTVWGVGVVAGGLTGGQLVDKLGRQRALHSAIFLCLGAGLALSMTFNMTFAWVLVFVFGLAYGFYETVYFALSMYASDPRIAASMFSILMAVANIGTGIGLGLSGSMVDGLGYRPTFILLALANFLAFPLLPVIFSRSGKSKTIFQPNQE